MIWSLAFLIALSFAPTLFAQDSARPPLRLAMSGTFRPFSVTDASGKLVGFDADMAREIAERLGRRPVLVQTDWAGIQAGLQSRKYDLICASMAITDARRRTMLFSLPYYVSGAQVFARHGLRDLRGARVGVTENSTYEHYIDTHPAKFPDVKVLRYGSEAESVAAMNAGKIDALVSDRIVGGFYIRMGAAGGIEPMGGLLYREVVGISARKDSPELIREVNDALFAMIQDGTYAKIYQHWVGSKPDLGLLFSAWGKYHDPIPRTSPEAGTTQKKAAFVSSLPSVLELLGKGAVLTIILSLLTGILALGTGCLIGIGTVARSSLLRQVSNGYVWVVRGTPLLVQLFIAYFGISTLVNRVAGFEAMGAFGAALLALVVNTTAYNAETIRGGIGAIDSGQWDAAASLGMTRRLILRRIILPQAFRDSLPSLGNNLVVLIKDTSLVGAITLVELTYAARNVVFQTGHAFGPFLVAAAFYLVIITTVTIGVRAWEGRLRRSVAKVRSTL